MDEQLASGLDVCMARQDLNMEGPPGSIFSQLIMELEPSLAEKILVTHWARIKNIPHFFQAALFVNTARTPALAADTFARSVDRQKILQHLHSHFGFDEHGRSHRVTLGHLNALLSYLDYLGERELLRLWHDCNRRRWFEWRRRNLDCRLATAANGPRIDVASREELLDRFSANKLMIWSGVIEMDFCEFGYSVDEAFPIIADWAAKRDTQDALHVAATFFTKLANRRHLPLFDTLIAGKPERQSLRQSVYFAVRHRTLM